MLAIVLVLAAGFGYAAADRLLALARSSWAPLDEPVVLGTVSAIAALTVHLTLAG